MDKCNSLGCDIELLKPLCAHKQYTELCDTVIKRIMIRTGGGGRRGDNSSAMPLQLNPLYEDLCHVALFKHKTMTNNMIQGVPIAGVFCFVFLPSMPIPRDIVYQGLYHVTLCKMKSFDRKHDTENVQCLLWSPAVPFLLNSNPIYQATNSS